MENLLNMSLNMIHIKEENKAIVQIVTEELWLNYFNNYLNNSSGVKYLSDGGTQEWQS